MYFSQLLATKFYLVFSFFFATQGYGYQFSVGLVLDMDLK